MNPQLKTQLKALQAAEHELNPRKEWVEDTRAMLLSRIQSERSEYSAAESSVGVVADAIAESLRTKFAWTMYIGKPVMVSVLVFAIASSGWIASASATNSLPGDTLWRVKLATEKTQVVLAEITGNDTKEVALQLKFAARRAEEIKIVAAEERFDAEEKTKRTEEGVEKLKENVASVDESIKKTIQFGEDVEKKELGKVAKDLSTATEEVADALDAIASAPDSVLSKDVHEMKQTLDEVDIEVARVAVEGAENDAERIEAEQLVEDKIVSLITDADKSIDESVVVKDLAEQVEEHADHASVISASGAVEGTENTVSGSEGVVDVPVLEVSSSSPIVTGELDVFSDDADQTGDTPESETVVLLTVDELTSRVEEASQEVQTRAEEVRTLITDGNLSEALDKARDLGRATSVSEQVNTDTKSAVEQVLSDTSEDTEETTDVSDGRE